MVGAAASEGFEGNQLQMYPSKVRKLLSNVSDASVTRHNRIGRGAMEHFFNEQDRMNPNDSRHSGPTNLADGGDSEDAPR
jgi:hypothetical protein